MKDFWNRIVRWSGWKYIFPLPVWIVALLFLGSGGALIWIFVRHLEQWWPAYVLYVLSAYCLTALCIQLPAAISKTKQWLQAHPKMEWLLKDKQFHFLLELYFEQFINCKMIGIGGALLAIYLEVCIGGHMAYIIQS